MTLKAVTLLLATIGLSPCNYQSAPSSVSLLCKPVRVEHSNALFFTMADFAREHQFEMIVDREEIEILEGREPLPHNRGTIRGVLKDGSRYVLGFSNTELRNNAYALSFYSYTEPEFKEEVLSAATAAIEPLQIVEFTGNAFNTSKCDETPIIE